MAVKIRLARMGSKKRPYYRIVAADARSPRDGRFLERIGTYDPHAEAVILNEARVSYWEGVGAHRLDGATLLADALAEVVLGDLQLADVGLFAGDLRDVDLSRVIDAGAREVLDEVLERDIGR